MIEHRAAALAVLGLALITTFHFPGITWLQSDTQIYIPIFEHLDKPSALANDPVAVHPHVSWTVYEEVSILARRVFGIPFQTSLQWQQFLTRLLGIAGVYLLARRLFATAWPALFVAGCFSLGAVINGPAVLTFEYEPVPRGFAVMLIFLAIGLTAWERPLAAGIAASTAFLYHPPTTAAFWGCALLYGVWGPRRRQSLRVLYPLAGGVMILLLMRFLQHGEREPQPLFGVIDATLAEVQRIRGAYNWIELWPRDWLWQYPLLFLVILLAWRRLRPLMPPQVRFLSLALPITGLLTIPLSWLLLDRMRWIFIPQFQPARAVLFVTAFATILAAAAAWHAGAQRRWWEAAAWLAPVYAIPANNLVLPLFQPWRADAITITRLLLVAGLSLLGAMAACWASRFRWLAPAAILAPFALIPTVGGMRNFPDLHTPAIHEAADWAARSTPPESVFLFADAHRDLAPGIFRARATRALYVDWKSGGQVNLLRGFASEWRQRWFYDAHECKPPLRPAGHYRSLGVNYLVLRNAAAPPGLEPVYRNSLYRVYDLSRPAAAPPH